MNQEELKREIYKVCMNPFKLLISSYYGFGMKDSKAIVRISNTFNESIIEDDSLDMNPMFALSGIKDEMIQDAFRTDNETEKVLKMLDIVLLARKCTSEIYDQMFITKASTSEFSKEIFTHFLSLPKLNKMSMVSIIESELENHNIPTAVISKFMDVVSPMVLNVQNIISEFIDDEEVSDMIEEQKQTNEESIKNEAVKTIIAEEGKDMSHNKTTTKRNKKKNQDNKKEKPTKDIKIKNGEIELDAKTEIKIEKEEIKKQTSDDLIMDGKEVKELITAIDQLDKEVFIKKYITVDEIILNTKKLLRHILYIINNIPNNERDLSKTIPCSSGKLRKISTVFSDEADKSSCRVDSKIFRSRFSSYIIEYLLDNIDEYFEVSKECGKPEDMTEVEYAKQFTNMLCFALLATMKGKYHEGLTVFSDMVCVMNTKDLENSNKWLNVYNNGVTAMESMSRMNKSFKDIVKMAYIMSTDEIKDFNVDDCVDEKEMMIELGKYIGASKTTGILYQMYIKSRPSVPTKIKDIQNKDNERRAVLSLNFISMMFGNRTVNKLIKACI